jgi:hypothetical protein
MDEGGGEVEGGKWSLPITTLPLQMSAWKQKIIIIKKSASTRTAALLRTVQNRFELLS